MIDFNNTLETNQILLRPLSLDDYDRFLKITTDKDLWIYFTNDLSDNNELLRWIETGEQEIKNEKRGVVFPMPNPCGAYTCCVLTLRGP